MHDEPNTDRPPWLLAAAPRSDNGSSNQARQLLLRLMRGENLNHGEAGQLLNCLLDEDLTDAQIAATLVSLTVKGETVEELAGMAAVMRQRATPIHSRHKCFIDTAGTGSSAAKTFNVSTAAALVIAGAGLPVAKHGSRAATSLSGSADVLTSLGVKVTASPALSQQCLNEIGICFMFAPLYHGATARVAAIRRELGVQTSFNLLGPLTNPAQAPRQVIGVWHSALVEPLSLALSRLGTERAWVVSGSDGLDEMTIAGPTSVAETEQGRTRTFQVSPEDFGLKRSSLDHIRRSDAESSAHIIREVLSGKRRDAARDLIVINAAAGLVVGSAAVGLREASLQAGESIDSGAARNKLEALIKLTNEEQSQ